MPPRARSTQPVSVLAALLLLLPLAARAQSSAIVDEGTLLVLRNGVAVGRESFRIVRSPGPNGQVFVSTGQSAIGENRVTSRLGTDSSGVPVSYEANLSVRGEQVQRLQGRGRPGRFSVLLQTRTGESAKDFQLTDGALLLDDEVFHQFYFVTRLAAHSQLIAINPRAGSQTPFTLADHGADSVTIGRQAIQARHYALMSSSVASVDVWVDAAGRLLKVAIPEKSLLAVRDAVAR